MKPKVPKQSSEHRDFFLRERDGHPFPTAKFVPIEAIISKAVISDRHNGEIFDLVALLKEQSAIEFEESGAA